MYNTGKVLRFCPYGSSAGKEIGIDTEGRYYVKVFAYTQTNDNVARMEMRNIPCSTETEAETIYNNISSIADVKTYLESCKS